MSGLLGMQIPDLGLGRTGSGPAGLGQVKRYPHEIQAGLLQNQLRNLHTLLNSCVIKSDNKCDWMNHIASIHALLLDLS